MLGFEEGDPGSQFAELACNEIFERLAGFQVQTFLRKDGAESALYFLLEPFVALKGGVKGRELADYLFVAFLEQLASGGIRSLLDRLRKLILIRTVACTEPRDLLVERGNLVCDRL